MTPVRIAIVGAGGRMGSRIDAIASNDPSVLICARFHRENLDQQALAASAEVIVDFSCEPGTRAALGMARMGRAALLVGTTGLSDATRGELVALSAERAVLVAPNVSFGVAVVRRLAHLAATLLGPAGWTVDLIETHHDRKKDAPSGTALALAESLSRGGLADAGGRIHSIRAGDVVGEHEIRLAGPGERIQLAHQADSRDLFAQGAIRAAKWLAGRPPGAYSMDDVLGSA